MIHEMASEMVERLERIVANSALVEHCSEQHLAPLAAELVVAILTAMHEPTEAMLEVAWSRTHPACGDPLPQSDEIGNEGWVSGMYRAMIEKALK